MSERLVINTVLVDDEAGCIDNLRFYIQEYCPALKIVNTASNLSEAKVLLADQDVALAFLDVQLFDQNIFDALQHNSRKDLVVVFVTAYEHYALNAFRVSAVDYLLKPIVSGELKSCYDKILRHFNAGSAVPPRVPKAKRIVLRDREQVFLLSIDQILVLKANGFYTQVLFEHGQNTRRIMLSKPLQAVLDDWDQPELLRVHRSYAVNTKHISGVRKMGSSVSLSIGNETIPVAKRRSNEFLDAYGQ